ncbi:MAG TPA: ABC transporter ATP-binding protein [Polyangiaceae bacterium]
MIEAQHLSKDYGAVLAVADLSFRVGRGEIVGFLGPNGAGKTTTLRMLAGFLGPSSGRVSIDGVDMQANPRAAKSRIGYMPEASPLYPEMRVREYLDFRAALKGVKRIGRRDAVESAMGRAAVLEVADTVVQHLSKGYRQRVGLADALVASPPLLILDEPTAGLDPNQIREVRQLVRELGKTHTILLSTHILSEVEAVCDRAIVLDRGRLVAEGTLADLTMLGTARTLALEVRDPMRRAQSIALGVPGVLGLDSETEPDGENGIRRLVLRTGEPPETVAEAVTRALVRAELGVRSIGPGRASLEDVFAALTRDDTAPASAAAGSTA